MDVQKYFNKGSVTWYAKFDIHGRLERILPNKTRGSIAFQTETYEAAYDRRNMAYLANDANDITYLINMAKREAPDKRHGLIELVFLKICLSPKILENERFYRVILIKAQQAFVSFPESKIINDAMEILNNMHNMHEPVIKGVLQPI